MIFASWTKIDEDKMNLDDKNVFQRFSYHVKERGFKNTFRWKIYQKVMSKFSNYYFDYKFGVETRTIVPLDRLKIMSENKSCGVDYWPTNYYLLKNVFSNLRLNFSESNFVDYGAGKGRAMLFASQYGFKKVKGIEFSRELSQICQRNIRTYLKKKKQFFDYQILNMDAVNYQVQNEDNVFYFYNPFTERVMENVLVNIDESLKKKKRDIALIYVNSDFSEYFQRRYRQTYFNDNILETRIFKN